MVHESAKLRLALAFAATGVSASRVWADDDDGRPGVKAHEPFFEDRRQFGFTEGSDVGEAGSVDQFRLYARMVAREADGAGHAARFSASAALSCRIAPDLFVGGEVQFAQAYQSPASAPA